MKGYFEDAETSDLALRGGYFHSGDAAVVHPDYAEIRDRMKDVIISGGENVYPAEVENAISLMEGVGEVAVIGVPNEEFGEEVKAVVQPKSWSDAGPELAAELMEFCRENISHIKCPRSVDFEQELPRHPTGKLYKRLLKDRYWAEQGKSI